MPIYLKHNFKQIPRGEWYTAISNSKNPVVKGYLAENCCLSSIQEFGLRLGTKRLPGLLQADFFNDVPDWGPFLRDTSLCRLYLPSTFNYANIDAAILSVTRYKKKPKAMLYLIQVTIAKRHENSEKKFYKTQWNIWKDKLGPEWTVSSTFVWIDMVTTHATEVQAQATQDGLVEIPAHTQWHVNVKDVDEELYARIGSVSQ